MNNTYVRTYISIHVGVYGVRVHRVVDGIWYGIVEFTRSQDSNGMLQNRTSTMTQPSQLVKHLRELMLCQSTLRYATVCYTTQHYTCTQYDATQYDMM